MKQAGHKCEANICHWRNEIFWCTESLFLSRLGGACSRGSSNSPKRKGRNAYTLWKRDSQVDLWHFHHLLLAQGHGRYKGGRRPFLLEAGGATSHSQDCVYGGSGGLRLIYKEPTQYYKPLSRPSAKKQKQAAWKNPWINERNFKILRF